MLKSPLTSVLKPKTCPDKNFWIFFFIEITIFIIGTFYKYKKVYFVKIVPNFVGSPTSHFKRYQRIVWKTSIFKRQKYFGFWIPKLGTPQPVLFSIVYWLSNTYVFLKIVFLYYMTFRVRGPYFRAGGKRRGKCLAPPHCVFK